MYLFDFMFACLLGRLSVAIRARCKLSLCIIIMNLNQVNLVSSVVQSSSDVNSEASARISEHFTTTAPNADVALQSIAAPKPTGAVGGSDTWSRDVYSGSKESNFAILSVLF